MLFPSIGVVCQCVVVAWFLGTMILIYSTKPESIDMALGMVANTSSPEFEALGVSAALENVDPIGPIRGFMENENAITYLTIIVLYGFFVLIQFVQGISWCAPGWRQASVPPILSPGSQPYLSLSPSAALPLPLTPHPHPVRAMTSQA